MRDDRLVEADIREALQWDERVDDGGIRVLVENGVVALIGHVHTQYEKEIAAHVADRIKGAERIENHLQLVHEGILEDDEIADEIRLALEHDLAVSDANKVQVHVARGQVTLTGTVPTQAERQAVEEDARQTAGVVAVDNQILVTRSHTLDEQVVQGLRRDLSSTLQMDMNDLEVSCDDGVVTLRGMVPSLLHKYLAEEAAYFQPGVIHVVNELGVHGEEIAA